MSFEEFCYCSGLLHAETSFKTKIWIIWLSSLRRSSYIISYYTAGRTRRLEIRVQDLGHLRISVGDGELDCPISPTKIKKIVLYQDTLQHTIAVLDTG